MKEKNIEVTYIEEPNIKLLDRNGNTSNMQGFIGGASFVFDNKFVLFGDIEKLKSKQQIIEHLNRHNLKLVSFEGLQVNDYGGAIEF